MAYQEIRDALIMKINAESILILNSIQDVEIHVVGYPEEIQISKKRYPMDQGSYRDNVFGLSIWTTISNRNTGAIKETDNDYLLFTDAEKEAAVIIFRFDGKKLKAVKNSRIYAFFPTAKEAHQNFYIHAPFDTTPARDNFKEGAEYGKHNIILLKEDAADTLKDTFETLFAARDEHFGNARTARNYFERSINAQADRLARKEQISDEELAKITAEDIAVAIGGRA